MRKTYVLAISFIGLAVLGMFQNMTFFSPQKISLSESTWPVINSKYTYSQDLISNGFQKSLSNGAKLILDEPYVLENQKSVDCKILATCFDIQFDPQKKRPLIVFIHGGGWKQGTYSGHILKMGQTFYNAGYAFASIGYRLASEATSIHDLTLDVASAISLIRKRADIYNVDQDFIVVMGHSAGAHVSAIAVSNPYYFTQAQVDPLSIKGLILLDGSVYDFKTLSHRPGVVGQAPVDMWDFLSPVHNVNTYGIAPPTLIISDIVRNVPTEVNYPDTGMQAELLFQALRNKNLLVRLFQYEDKSHGDFLHHVTLEGDDLNKQINRFISFILPIRLQGLLSLSNNKLSEQTIDHLTDPSVYDWRVYFAKNFSKPQKKDIVQNHWINIGIKKGLSGHPNFSVINFLKNNSKLESDLRQIYGEYVNEAAIAYYSRFGEWLGYERNNSVSENISYGAVLDNPDGLKGEAILGNNLLRVVTTGKYAGAITELWYNNIQLVNSGAKGYGRLFQIAGWKNRQSMCYNPIEAGGRYLEDKGQDTKTDILEFNVSKDSIVSSVYPSLFRMRGEDTESCRASNAHFDEKLLPPQGQEIDSDIIFEKKITLNTFGVPNIMTVDLNIGNLKEQSHLIFQLYAAINKNLSEIYTLDFEKCKNNPSDASSCDYAFREDVIKEKYSKKYPTILSTKDGNVAFALYYRRNNTGPMGSYSAEVRSGEDDKGTTDTAISFAVGSAPANKSYKVPIYAIVGSKEMVRKLLHSLYQGKLKGAAPRGLTIEPLSTMRQ